MSQENVEIVRRAYDAWDRGDMDAMLATLHPALVYVTSGVFPGLDPAYHGHDGFRRFWRDFRGTWESLSIAVDELRDCGERILGLLEFNARGRDGLEVQRQAANVWTLQDGLAVRIENHGDWARALEAVGLSEDPPKNA
jgi:ketosteroid isomerase-like protein